MEYLCRIHSHFPQFISVAAAFVCGVVATRIVAVTVTAFRSLRVKRRFRRGAEGEKEAESYLRKHGFSVEAAQVEKTAELQVDGTVHDYTIRPDYLMKRGGKTCIVEVKTGQRAVDPLFGDTRRQLLEYAANFNVDKVYLFNADDAALSEISFPVLKKERRLPVVPFLAGILCGLVVALRLAG